MISRRLVRAHRVALVRVPGYRATYKTSLVVRNAMRAWRVLTPASAWQYCRCRLRVHRERRQGILRLRFRRGRYGCDLRLSTSDLLVFEQVFLAEQYRLLKAPALRANALVDAGANIGLASLYFLMLGTKARLVAIEPDDGNFRMLTRNLAPFADQCLLIHGAVWPEARQLATEPDNSPHGQWAVRVREQAGGLVKGWTMADILAALDVPTVGVVKMDIEGAEIGVLGRADEWLPRVSCLGIELHGPEAERTLDHVLAERRARRRQDGEVTVVDFD